MSIIRNAIKGPISSILGVIVICITVYACTFEEMEWVWNGLAGCGFGCVLIFTPDSIKEIISAVVTKKTK